MQIFCGNPTCERQIFTERLPQLTEPWARRTNRMTRQIKDIGLALGGAAGAWLIHRVGYVFSHDTVDELGEECAKVLFFLTQLKLSNLIDDRKGDILAELTASVSRLYVHIEDLPELIEDETLSLPDED